MTLWSIISLLAPNIDENLKSGVRSFRLKKSQKREDLFEEISEIVIPFLKSSFINSRIAPFVPWHYNWKEFDQLSKDAFEAGYRYLAVTDISAYFENINLEILRDLLLKYHPQEQKIVNLLMAGLHSWAVETPTGSQPKRGIPQGTGVSSFLGNMFLMPVDEALHPPQWNVDSIYLRYVDDIRVFCKTKSAAINALLVLEENLRKIHLSVQTAKTKVLFGREIEELLYDDRIDQIKDIRARYPSRAVGAAAATSRLLKVGDKRSSNSDPLSKRFVVRDGLNDRATRMWFNSLMFYGSTAYVSSLTHVVLRNADPRYSEIFVRTAKRFPNFSYNRAQIYSYLDGPENIFEYHECHILESFRYMSKRSDVIFNRCMKIIASRNSYNLKLAATRYLAKWRLTPMQILAVKKALTSERLIPCVVGYLQLLSQQSPSDFANTMSIISRIPSFQSVDAIEFVRQVTQFSSFTRSFLGFVFDIRFRFRLADWIGVLWIMSHTRDRKLKKHLDGLARRREIREPDALLVSSLRAIRGRLT
ncbi:MAG: RNA-directed DNA polymerase [Mesorhizobium sp.]